MARRKEDFKIVVSYTLTMSAEQYETWKDDNGLDNAGAVRDDVRQFLLDNTLAESTYWQSAARNT